MIIKTKFSIGDEVCQIYKSSEAVYAACPTCEKTGKIQVKGMKDKIVCPNCNGNCRKLIKYIDKYIVGNPFTIKNVRYQSKTRYRPKEIHYMDNDSGCGSLYDEKFLYESEEEAQKACDKLNEEIEDVLE